MNASYTPNPRRKYIVETELYVDDLIAVLDAIGRNPKLREVHKSLSNALHNIVCTERITREELVKILKIANDQQLDFLKMDCESRIRNLSSN